MDAPWLSPFTVESLDDEEGWDLAPSSAGVYVILRQFSINRIGGIDRSGILYVGQAPCLRDRLWKFYEAYHPASGFLWTHPSIAGIVLGKKIRGVSDVENGLGKLKVRVATPIGLRMLNRTERAALFAYVNRFGEAPPLNFAIPERWKVIPTTLELRWAEEGLNNPA